MSIEAPSLINADNTYTIVVPETNLHQRLDLFIASHFPKFSRTFFQKLISNHLILVNEKPTKASYQIKVNDQISIQIPPARVVPHIISAETRKELDQLPVTVVYEQPEFIIINKPAGLVVHKPSAMSTTITLVDWLLYKFPALATVGDEARPGIVHRLDKDTSGLMIIARTPAAHHELSKHFRERSIEKTYLAVVEGHPKKTGTIELAIGRDILHPTKMSQKTTKSRAATTHFEVIEYFTDAALVKVRPITGRTHQIRVHFAAIKHPVIGDRLYGKESHLIARQALHASNLSFNFNELFFSFHQVIPADMALLIEVLKKA